MTAFYYYFLAYGFSVGGLIASTFHLGNPKNAYKSFSQWRTSWLSREAWLALITLSIYSILAINLIFLENHLAWLGIIAALIAVMTVFSTAMIYAQLKTIPRWNHFLVPVYFLVLALTGGALLTNQVKVTVFLLLSSLAIQILLWLVGDKRFSSTGTTMETATGLGHIGKVRLFEPPHTGNNYLLQEMVYVIGRKHAYKIRLICLLFLGITPIVILLLFTHSIFNAVFAFISHLIGAIMSRWLFFAEAEHVIGLYYGKR